MAWGESRRGTPITLIGIHTNEGNNPADVFPDRTAEQLAEWLDRENTAGRHKSYHRICDDDSTVLYVPDSEAAWALPGGGNLPGLQLCFTGWARWDRAEWLDHRGMLLRGAQIVRDWCDTYTLHKVHLMPDQVAAGHRGVIGHADWTRSGAKRGNHTDPGSGFPWDVFLKMINRGDDMTDERDALYDIREQVCGARPVGQYPGWPTAVGDLTLVDMVRRLLEEVAVEDLAQRADVGFARDQLVERLVRVEGKLDELLERSTDTEPVS